MHHAWTGSCFLATSWGLLGVNRSWIINGQLESVALLTRGGSGEETVRGDEAGNFFIGEDWPGDGASGSRAARGTTVPFSFIFVQKIAYCSFTFDPLVIVKWGHRGVDA